MGIGDNVLATGLARGAKARGKRIAFGDNFRIIWDKHSAEVFRGNPNIAKPGSERDKDIEWVRFFKGARIYNRQDKAGNRWIWNYEFKPIPGELFFDDQETHNAARYGKGFVLIEPNVPNWKSCAPNKDWGFENYQGVADRLKRDGFTPVQFKYERGGQMLQGVKPLKTMGFRDAAAILSHAALYVGAEGGLHHAAAAVGTPAVVLFGGFIPPAVTGYASHINLTGGAEACGSLSPCQHCKAAMRAISIDDVYDATREKLETRR